MSRSPSESFSAQTLGHVVDDHALSVGSTGHCLARMTTLVAHIRFWTQTALVLVTNSISGALAVRGTTHHGNATDSRVWISDRSRRTSAFEGSRQIVANSAFTAGVWLTALVKVHTESLGVSGETRGTLARVSSGNVLANCIISTLSRRSMNWVALVNVNATSGDVARVEGPAFLADTIRLHTVRFTEGMWSAGDVLAGSFAFHTGRSANVSRKTVALEGSGRVDALRVRATDSSSCAALVDVHAH